jgi:hypothetical protein
MSKVTICHINIPDEVSLISIILLILLLKLLPR